MSNNFGENSLIRGKVCLEWYKGLINTHSNCCTLKKKFAWFLFLRPNRETRITREHGGRVFGALSWGHRFEFRLGLNRLV